MRYLKVKWIHNHPNEPIELYSECDQQGWEVRKVEIFRQGQAEYASREVETGGSRLGVLPNPELEEIASDPEFIPTEIDKTEFERVWENLVKN